MDTSETLLKAILSMVARMAFPPEGLAKLICPKSGGEKYFMAFNLCDGQTPQVEIVRKTELDQGNISRAILRWIELGIVIRVGEEQHPMHIYPLPKEYLKKKQKKVK